MDQPRDKYGRFGSTHGIRTANFAEKCSDKRTVLAKRLNGIIDAIVDDLGGHEALNAGDRVTVDILKSKLMVLLRLSDWIDLQPDIVKDGQLLYVLGRDYIRYLDSTEKTLERLYKGYNRGKPTKTLEEIIAQHKSA